MNKISPIIVNRFPSFVKRNYQQFVLVMQLYFEWLEQEGNVLHYIESYLDEFDTSNESSQYWDSILSDLGFMYKRPIHIEHRQLVVFLRDYYASRGSRQSAYFLFKLFFNEVVKVNYPRDQMLVPSFSEYKPDFIMFSTFNNNNSQTMRKIHDGTSNFDLIGYGLLSESYCNIEYVDILKYGSKSYMKMRITTTSEFIPGETIKIFSNDWHIQETLLPSVEITVKKQGSDKFVSNEEITGINSINTGKLIVKSVTKGCIDSITIKTPGTNYEVGDVILSVEKCGLFATVEEVGLSGEITKVKLQNGGYNLSELPVFYVRTKSGSGAEFESKSTSIGNIKKLVIVDPFFSDYPNTQKEFTCKNTVFKVTPIAVFETQKYRRDTKGIIGINGIITDSLYYQQFSYRLDSNVPLHEYNDIVMNEIHPPGYILFARMNIEDKLSYNVECTDIVDIE